MGDKLLGALRRLSLIETPQHSPLHSLDGRAKIAVTLLYLVALLSLPLDSLAGIILMSLVPIAGWAVGRLRGRTILRWALLSLPFTVAVGAFNPLLDREPVAEVAGVTLTHGWITLCGLILRGVLSVSVVVELVLSTGVYRLCVDAGRLGVPAVVVALVLMVYRYMRLLMGEVLTLRMAVDARRQGRGALPMRVWARVVGVLLIGSVRRARWVGMALEARAGGGVPRFRLPATKWRTTDTLFVVFSAVVITLLRFVDCCL